MAGHSKWANIKRKKAVVDAKRGKIFTRISKEITVAAKQGGGDPDANPRLRLAVQAARSENMPLDNIKRAIQKGTGELEGASYEEITYEGYAPLGVAVLVETVTDNRNRTVAEIRHLFNKYDGNLGEAGAVAWNFIRKGAIHIEGNFSEEELLEHVIESGAEDMEISDEAAAIYCSPDTLAKCSKYFENNKFTVKESKFEFLPNTMVKIGSREDAEKVMKFMDAIEDHDDVQNIFSNADIPEEILSEIEA